MVFCIRNQAGEAVDQKRQRQEPEKRSQLENGRLAILSEAVVESKKKGKKGSVVGETTVFAERRRRTDQRQGFAVTDMPVLDDIREIVPVEAGVEVV